MKKNVNQVYKNSLGEFVRVLYRNKALFTQILGGKKDNYYSVKTIKKAKEIVCDLGLVLTNKKFVSYGIGWNVA